MLSTKLAAKLDNLKLLMSENNSEIAAKINEEFLERRFSKQKTFAENVKLEFSKNSDSLAQYYSIREAMYKTVLDYHEPIHIEEKMDKQSEILLVKSGDACVGGARLTISRPQERILLPMESADFNLANSLPTIDFSDIIYSEVSRVALLPKYSDGEIIKKLYRKIADRRVDNSDVEIMFFATYPIHARKVKQVCKSLGIDLVKCKIQKPKSFFVSDKIELSLYACDLTKNLQYSSKLRSLNFSSQEEAEEELIPELV